MRLVVFDFDGLILDTEVPVYDVWQAMWFTDAAGATTFGIGVGTIILAINVVLLASYTWGCHVLRHVVGGQFDEGSKIPACDFA